MSDIIPLFSTTQDGEEQKIIPLVRDSQGRLGKTDKLISDLAKEIEEDATSLASGENGALMTVGGYVLLETLLRLGLGEQVNAIKKNSAVLQQASLFCAIGMLAGRELPGGTTFETKYSSSDTDIRELKDREDS
jgi:hypothetical protein